jgi:catechol 2,3-dioxygenase-like lactoylglutathione lyase family enzyme
MDGYLRLRQVCLVAPELEAAVEDIGAIFGLEVCHRSAGVEEFGLTNALFAAGTSFIEVVAPFREGTAAGRFLDRSQGRGGYMAIFDSPDPDAYLAHAASIGVRAIFEIDRPGAYRCIQFHPRDCRATMLDIERTYGGESLTGPWLPAGPSWQEHADARTTRGITAIEAVSPRPDDLAAHWSSILQRPVDRARDHLTIRVDGPGVRIAANARDDRELLDAVVIDVVDQAQVMAAATRRGKASGPGAIDLCGMTFRLVS